MEAQDGGAAEPGKLHHTGFGHESWAARSIRSDGGLQALAQSPDHFHQDAGSSAAAGTARRRVTVPMNDARYELAVEILADHHHHAPLAPIPDGGKDFAVPEGNDETFSAPHRFVIMLFAVNFPAQAAANQQHHEVTHPVGQK